MKPRDPKCELLAAAMLERARFEARERALSEGCADPLPEWAEPPRLAKVIRLFPVPCANWDEIATQLRASVAKAERS